MASPRVEMANATKEFPPEPADSNPIRRLARPGNARDLPVTAAQTPQAGPAVVRGLLADRPLVRSVAEIPDAPAVPEDKVVPVRWARTVTPQTPAAIQRAAGARPRPAVRPAPGPASAPNWPSRHGSVLSEAPVQRVPAGPAPAVVAPVRPPAGPGAAPVVPARWVPELPIAAPAPPAVTPVQRDAEPQTSVTPGTPVTISRRSVPDPPPEPDEEPEHTSIDELARRLAEPVSRLLRAELRFGRERAGRLHNRRR